MVISVNWPQNNPEQTLLVSMQRGFSERWGIGVFLQLRPFLRERKAGVGSNFPLTQSLGELTHYPGGGSIFPWKGECGGIFHGSKSSFNLMSLMLIEENKWTQPQETDPEHFLLLAASSTCSEPFWTLVICWLNKRRSTSGFLWSRGPRRSCSIHVN